MSLAQKYLDLILAGGQSAGPALEGGSSRRDQVPAGLKRELLERLAEEIVYIELKTGVPVDRDGVRELLKQADAGLTRLLDDGPDARLDQVAVSGLEAVVRTDGSRPVLFVEDDCVDVTAPSIGAYAVPLSRFEDQLRSVCQAVGRVDDPSDSAAPLGYQGTAWAIGEGLVVTNYHVLAAIAPGGIRFNGRFQGRLNTGVAVHFGHEVGYLGHERRFPIRRVVSVGQEGAAELAHPDYLDLNFDGLDLAVLELEPVPGQAFPEPVLVARGDDQHTRGGLASAGHGIYVVGYPGDQRATPADLFAQLFAGVRGYKRLAPGLITATPGEVPHDPRQWIVTHDASTLGGNSGSALVDLDTDGRTVLGLHFAGVYAQQNWAYALERITPVLDAARAEAVP